jgi:hypothetical protein
MTSPAEGTALVPAEKNAVAETSSSAVAARERAGVEARFLMALKMPRDPEAARLRLLKACRRPGFAETARYMKPVGRTKVEGLSIRFAEEAARLWGNVAIDVAVVFDDAERRIYRIAGVDLETNSTSAQDLIVEKFIERRSTRPGQVVISSRQNTNGEVVYLLEASEDEVFVKANAGISKIRRNIILTLIPSDIQEECEREIVATMETRDQADPEGQKKAVFRMFFTLGVQPKQLVDLLGTTLEATLTPAQFTLLRSWHTALKEGAATWAELEGAFVGEGKPTASSDLQSRLEARKKKQAPKEPEPAPTPEAGSQDQREANLELDRELALEEGGRDAR